MNAFIIYKYLYGRKNPLVTHEGRVHTIGVSSESERLRQHRSRLVVSRSSARSAQPGLQEWRPFALSVFLVITTLLGLIGVTAPPRKPEVDGLGSSSEVPS